MSDEWSPWGIGTMEHSAYVSGIEVGVAFERKRIANLIREKTYDSAAGHSLSWIMDASNVERDELVALVEGKDF